MTASGCGATVREYAHYLQEDERYRDRAARIASLTRDLCEVVDAAALPQLGSLGTVAFQSPCSLQHGQQSRGKVEAILARVGFSLCAVDDAHLCCGSAGTYSLLQPELSGELRRRKLDALQQQQPARIATANVGCLAHLQAGTSTPVTHWIEAVDEALRRKMPG